MATEDEYTPEDRARVEAMAAVWQDVMSKGDKSTAMAILDPPPDPETGEKSEGRLLTSVGSPNDRFWTHMVALDWAVVDNSELDRLPQPEKFVGYKLTEAGKPMLAQFIRAVS